MTNLGIAPDRNFVRDKINPEVTEEDKEKFLESVLSENPHIPYMEVIEIFNGKIKLKFRTLTVEENNEVLAQIVQDEKDGVDQNTDAYGIQISAYRLGLSLVAVNSVPYTSNIAKDAKDKVKAKAKSFSEFSTPKLAAYLTAFATFEAKVLELSNHVNDPDFWEASAQG